MRGDGERQATAAIPACRLDLAGLQTQRERYRSLSSHVARVERSYGRLEAHFRPEVDERLLAETIAVERGCCPFFRIDYDEKGRRLSVSVDDESQDPALDALRTALTAA
jgi:hypothetical protein